MAKSAFSVEVTVKGVARAYQGVSVTDPKAVTGVFQMILEITEGHTEALREIIADQLARERDKILADIRERKKYIIDAVADGDTLKSLREKGHPYAKGKEPTHTPGPDSTMHVQRSGGTGVTGAGATIFDSLVPFDTKREGQDVSGIRFSNDYDAMIYKMLVFGTSKMAPRPLGHDIVMENLYRVRENIRTKIGEYFQQHGAKT